MNSTNKSYTLTFGLTADPIHKGHEQVIINSFEYANTQGLEIDQFLLIPTHQPNLIANKKQPRTAFVHRHKMCELAASSIRNNFNFNVYVTDIEKYLFSRNGHISYSYDTLKALDKPHMLFVLSADHFAGRWPKFRKWYKWQELVKENGLLIHQRPGHGINLSFIKTLQEINEEVFVVKNLPQVKISSTEIRKKLNAGRTISPDHISTPVAQYINNNQLYIKTSTVQR